MSDFKNSDGKFVLMYLTKKLTGALLMLPFAFVVLSAISMIWYVFVTYSFRIIMNYALTTTFIFLIIYGTHQLCLYGYDNYIKEK